MILVFDFDGVIVRNSEFAKRDAWRDVFGDVRRIEAVRKLSAKYAAGRGSRYDILADLFREEGAREEEIRDLVANAANAYNGSVQRRILAEGVDPGDLAALKRLSRRYALYIDSATPEEAMKETAASLGISELFAGIYGQPTGKSANLARAAEDAGATESDVLFVGDGDGDAKAAGEFGCRFVGIANDWNKWADKPFPLAKDLSELERMIG